MFESGSLNFCTKLLTKAYTVCPFADRIQATGSGFRVSAPADAETTLVENDALGQAGCTGLQAQGVDASG